MLRLAFPNLTEYRGVWSVVQQLLAQCRLRTLCLNLSNCDVEQAIDNAFITVESLHLTTSTASILSHVVTPFPALARLTVRLVLPYYADAECDLYTLIMPPLVDIVIVTPSTVVSLDIIIALDVLPEHPDLDMDDIAHGVDRRVLSEVALHKVHIRDKSPRSLNFIYQLGHHGGPCISPASSEPQNMVVIHVGGVFTLRVRFCGCAKVLGQDHITQLMSNGWYPATTIDPATCATFEALEQFRLLNVVGNLSAHNYVGTLERIMDATLLESTPDRYKAFSRTSRQYQFLKRAKRAGIAHDMAKMERVKIGGMAGWERCNKDDEFLYSLMLALDANFRLKNRLRVNDHEKHDPSLGSGWGYFVDSEPYKDHIWDYVAENDVSTCIVFAVLMQKDTRLTAGLRISGVGGRVCATHGIVRAEGLGDLQRGEQRVYANIDYILLHALGDARVKQLLLLYDITCQWRIHLRERVLKIANEAGLLPDLSNFDIRFGLPVWHAAAHEVNCQEAMSLSHLHGVGRTDGEGIERTWAILNPISFATKEMGEGNRLDSIEDKVDHVCLEKNVGQVHRRYIGRKIVIAVAEPDKQIAEFVDIDRGLEPDLRREWRQQVTDWLVDETKPNPYIMAGGKDADPSEAQVAANLRKAEAEEIRQGRGDLRRVGQQRRALSRGYCSSRIFNVASHYGHGPIIWPGSC
ncbi:hypothetical protein C8F01DRAFT_1255789 [Mycena amicta]|nr:hypothetical protein C8F01DRAFT_1255789 [Mycena amicta]